MIPETIQYLLFFVLGLVFGSFLNVLIYRLPLNLSIVSPRSFCPNCKYQIPFYRNIPLISYILQKGKCNNCESHINLRYPIVELLTALTWFLGSYYLLSLPEIIYFSIIASVLIAIAFIDFDHFIIPIPLIIFSMLFITSYLLFMKFNFGLLIYNNLIAMLIGTGYLCIIFIMSWLITKRQGLGYGDLQLLLVLGLWVGSILKIFLIIFGASLGAIIVWFIISYIKGYDKHRPLPYGTFLSITAIIIYLIPEKLIISLGFYLSLPFK